MTPAGSAFKLQRVVGGPVIQSLDRVCLWDAPPIGASLNRF
jgi:hypothetical protein